jgi:hypothetical protein
MFAVCVNVNRKNKTWEYGKCLFDAYTGQDLWPLNIGQKIKVIVGIRPVVDEYVS